MFKHRSIKNTAMNSFSEDEHFSVTTTLEKLRYAYPEAFFAFVEKCKNPASKLSPEHLASIAKLTTSYRKLITNGSVPETVKKITLDSIMEYEEGKVEFSSMAPFKWSKL